MKPGRIGKRHTPKGMTPATASPARRRSLEDRFVQLQPRGRRGGGGGGQEKQDNKMKSVGALRLGEAQSKYVRATLCLCLVSFCTLSAQGVGARWAAWVVCRRLAFAPPRCIFCACCRQVLLLQAMLVTSNDQAERVLLPCTLLALPHPHRPRAASPDTQVYKRQGGISVAGMRPSEQPGTAHDDNNNNNTEKKGGMRRGLPAPHAPARGNCACI